MINLIAEAATAAAPFAWWFDLADTLGVVSVMGAVIWFLVKDRREAYSDFKSEVSYNKERDKETLEVLQEILNTLNSLQDTHGRGSEDLRNHLHDARDRILEKIADLT